MPRKTVHQKNICKLSWNLVTTPKRKGNVILDKKILENNERVFTLFFLKFTKVSQIYTLKIIFSREKRGGSLQGWRDATSFETLNINFWKFQNDRRETENDKKRGFLIFFIAYTEAYAYGEFTGEGTFSPGTGGGKYNPSKIGTNEEDRDIVLWKMAWRGRRRGGVKKKEE